MIKTVLNNFDFRYYLKFAILFITMYYCYTIVIGVTTPGGTYYSFVDQYLNFPIVIRYFVLQGAHIVNTVMGVTTYINGDSLINDDGFKMVRMGWPCYGLMIKSFWLAYVLAHTSTLKKKLIWSLIGILCIYCLNCLRVGMMMVSMEKNWSVAEYINTNNHDFFNNLSYAVLILLIFIYNRRTTEKAVTN